MKQKLLLVLGFMLVTLGLQAEEVTLSFASTAQRISQDGNKQVWKNGVITFTNEKASSSTAVGNYSNPVRLYQGSSIDITIETIDRIQGMTVDYAILYIPSRNPGFALENRRFNVATSRAKDNTYIICPKDILSYTYMAPLVREYLVKLIENS